MHLKGQKYLKLFISHFYLHKLELEVTHKARSYFEMPLLPVTVTCSSKMAAAGVVALVLQVAF